MPLPPDVGAAIAAYLQSRRPVSDRRQLFLRAYPPHSGFPPTSGIRVIAARSLQPAGLSGIAYRGSHIFRHILSTYLLCSGVVLTPICPVLCPTLYLIPLTIVMVELQSPSTLP